MKEGKSYDSRTLGFHEPARAAGISRSTSEGSNALRDHRKPPTRPGTSFSLRSGLTEYPGGGAGSRFHITGCARPASDALREAIARSRRGGFLSWGMVSRLECAIACPTFAFCHRFRNWGRLWWRSRHRQPITPSPWSRSVPLAFLVLSDRGNTVARRYRLVFRVPDATRLIYQQRFGIDLPAFNDDASWELPIPGTFLVDQRGTVRLAFVDVVYTHRLEPSALLAGLRELAGQQEA